MVHKKQYKLESLGSEKETMASETSSHKEESAWKGEKSISDWEAGQENSEKGDCVVIGQEDDAKQGLELQRTVSLLGAISFTVGTIIGSGIFISPTSVLRNTGSVGLCLIVWAIGGVGSLLGSLTVSELACRVPKHGALYAYLREGLGDWVGFLFCWNVLLVNAPSAVAVKSLTFASYLSSMLSLCGAPTLHVRATAAAVILTVYVTNVVSNRMTVRINIIFLFAKLLALAIIIIGGIVALVSGKRRGNSELESGFEGTLESPGSIAQSFYFVMWAYGGWANANVIAEEVKNPKRNVPLAAVVGTLIVTGVYLLTNVSYLAVMSKAEMLSADTVATTWGNVALGTGAAMYVIPLCVMSSTAGSANGGLFASPRVLFSAARDGSFPEVLSFIHVNKRTPIPATTIVTALGILYATASNIFQLIQVVQAVDWLFYLLSAISLLILRHRQPTNMHVPFKQPLPVIVGFMLFSLYLVVMPLTGDDRINYAYTLAFFVTGLLLYLLFTFTKNRTNCCDGLVTTIQLLLQVGPPVPYVASAS